MADTTTPGPTPTPGPMHEVVGWASEHFEPVGGYFNTATAGLPMAATLREIERCLAEWRTGHLDPVRFDDDVRRSIDAYARIVGSTADSVAIGTQVASFGGVVAASLPAGATVLAAEEDFTSVLFPVLADDRLNVRIVPIEHLVESIEAGVDLVAASAVQSADGYLLDLDLLAERAAEAGSRTFVDATQAAGWVPIGAQRFDVTVCHTYKWLCAPRGVAFMTVNEAGAEWVKPRDAGWYAGDDPWTSIYGPPLRLASTAAKYHVSPAWFSFAGATPALEALADLGLPAIGDHSVGLANRFRAELGLEPTNSAIVSLELTPEAERRSQETGLVMAARAGRARFSFYVYNDVDGVVRAADIVRDATRAS